MQARRIEIWGGIECTLNRVRKEYFDQLARSGHDRRLTDLDRIGALGIRTLRYPLLWERIAPDGLAAADWAWSDERLDRLRSLGIRPIVGLVHHGGGPRTTHLLRPDFGRRLAEYAGAVAARYPWVDAYTPINEPLTTARFAALYGHWHPHRRSQRAFVRALLTECRATVLAMRAIRAVNPGAQLVQTDDICRVHSTPRLAYQARFENKRRWLGWDLLCGRVGPDHPLYEYLLCCGATREELAEFAQQPCPPDIIGLNYYLTSERFLDERLDRYPPETHGGNGRHRYADVAAVHATERIAGLQELLGETWRRYRLPLAVTEVHVGCSRDEQLRWLLEAWNAAHAAAADGVDVRAVTSWALLGSFDWNSLCTRCDGYYEPGAFDVRGPAPRPTAVAAAVRALADGRRPAHPVLAGRGWWKRPELRIYASPGGEPGVAGQAAAGSAAGGPPLLILGARGTLGYAFARICELRDLRYELLDRTTCDIAEPGAAERVLDERRPWAVVNATGYVRVDHAEFDAARCRRENAAGPERLARACAARGLPLVTFSSDLVFDGRAGRAYVESDAPGPLNEYGRSKAEGERLVLAAHPGALVVRTSAFFGPWDRHNFVTIALERLVAGEAFAAAGDLVVSPTYVPDLAHACLDLLIDGERGIWHLANEGAVSWAELARRAAALAGLSPDVVARPHCEMGFVAARPVMSALGSERGVLLPSLSDALRRYMAERRPAAATRAICAEAASA